MLPSALQVNLDALPKPKDWDEVWTKRIQELQPQEAALLHRQFLQKAALLLPSITAFGAGENNID